LFSEAKGPGLFDRPYISRTLARKKFESNVLFLFLMRRIKQVIG